MFRLFLWFLPVCLNAPAAFGFNYSVSGTGGLMIQPSSNYFLAVYGGAAEFSLEAPKILIRAQYLERPQYLANGYIEQEFSRALFLGGETTLSKWVNLASGLGFGDAYGYMAREEDLKINQQKQRYRLSGPSFFLALRMCYSLFSVSLSHQTLIGFADKEQTASRVSWPFNFLLFDFGIAL